MLKLHHQAERATSYRSFAPIEWSESLRSWCVFDPACIVAIFRSADFVVVEYEEEYAKLAQRTAINWSGLVGVLRNIPLANEGERHTKLRRDFAQLISARSGAAKSAVEDFVAQAVPRVFGAGHNPDLVQDLIRPIDDLLFAKLLGVPATMVDREGQSVSQTFDRFLSLNRRKAIQNAVAEISKALAAEAESLTTSVEYATALLVVGYDSLLGSLGASLVSVFEEAGSSRLCELNYPNALPRTGVPYIERVARKDCSLQGFHFRAGDRVRLFLDACPVRGSATESAPFFGKGRHLCLGKDLSQWVWRVLTEQLAQLPVRVGVLETRLRPNDYVFTVYDKIEVTVHG